MPPSRASASTTWKWPLEGYFDNIRKWAGVEDEGNPGYGRISAKCFVRADADEATLREIWRLAVEGSPGYPVGSQPHVC